MYDCALSQSASDGLKPYVAPSQRIVKPLALGKFSFSTNTFDGNQRSGLVALGAVDNAMV